MPRVTQPQIPLRVYRHFAAVTLVLTLAVAFFAEGEKREAAIEAHDGYFRDREADRVRAERYRQGREARLAAEKDRGQFSADRDVGLPEVAGTARRSGRPVSSTGLEELAQRTGYPVEVLARMSAEERLMLLEGLAEAEADVVDAAVRSAQASRLLAASSARSGAGGGRPDI